MEWSFLLNSILLGVGLAMDAFSVCLANGLNEPKMKVKRMCAVSSVFAVFQACLCLDGSVFTLLCHTLAHFKS